MVKEKDDNAGKAFSRLKSFRMASPPKTAQRQLLQGPNGRTVSVHHSSPAPVWETDLPQDLAPERSRPGRPSPLCVPGQSCCRQRALTLHSLLPERIRVSLSAPAQPTGSFTHRAAHHPVTSCNALRLLGPLSLEAPCPQSAQDKQEEAISAFLMTTRE